MKSLRRKLSVFLVVVLLISCIPMNVYAEEEKPTEERIEEVATEEINEEILNEAKELEPELEKAEELEPELEEETDGEIEEGAVGTSSEAVAKIGEDEYSSLAAAIEAAAATTSEITITMCKSVASASGISVPSGKNLVVDFDGHTYAVEKPGAGSTNTQTQAFQLLKDSTITFKNGTIKCTDDNKDFTWEQSDDVKGVAMIIQNYANLTLDNMVIDGTNIAHNGNNVRYVISNNSGKVQFVNNTVIYATGTDYAFDSCKYGSYATPSVSVTDSVINGRIELTGGEVNLNEDTITNGEIRVGENKDGTKVKGSILNINEGATVNTGEKWIAVFGKNTLNVSGKVNGYICTNGNSYNAGSVINIFNGADIKDEQHDVGIYMPNGELNIAGGTIESETAVYFKSTSLNITGGKLIGTGEKKEYSYNGNGGDATGDALVIDSCDYPNGIYEVTISGGYFKSYHGEAVAAFTSQDATPVTKFITGGYYSTYPVLSYIEEGYAVKASTESGYHYHVEEKGTEPISGPEEIVSDKPTNVEIKSNIPEGERNELQDIVKATSVSGVAEALSETGKQAIISEAIPEASISDVTLYNISITVKAEITTASTSAEPEDKILLYSLTPYAKVTAVNASGSEITSGEIEVKNDNLDVNMAEPIKVVLGCNFGPEQVLHIRKDKTVEKYAGGSKASYEERLFKYDSGAKTVTLYIKDFSDVKLLGKAVYANIRYLADGGTGSMPIDSAEIETEFTLPTCTFTAPSGKHFAGWEVPVYGICQEGEEIAISGDITVKAVWEQDRSTRTGTSSKFFTGTWGNPVTNGTWKFDPATGTWTYASSKMFKSTWGYIANPYAESTQHKADWFYFNAEGKMLTGWWWIKGSDGATRCYYLNPVMDNTLGACFIGPGTTPDGYTVDENGAWTLNGVVQTR